MKPAIAVMTRRSKAFVIFLESPATTMQSWSPFLGMVAGRVQESVDASSR